MKFFFDTLTKGLADLRSNSIFSSKPESDELSLNLVEEVDDVDEVGEAADSEAVVRGGWAIELYEAND